MGKYCDLKNEKKSLHESTIKEINRFDVVSDECDRVSSIVKNVNIIISNIDREFEKATKLNKIDVSFMLLATAIQCTRQYIFTNDKFRLTDKEGDKLVKGSIKKIVPKTAEEIICGSVPYDAIQKEEYFASLKISTELSGITHRYRTLGHDPILGWIFGPINIISDTLTKSDIITTYYIRKMKISGFYPNGTIGAFG